MAWRAILALAGVELRRSWRTLVALGLLAGFAGAVVVGGLAVGRRTETAPARLRAAVHLDDARVLVFGSREVGQQIAALPVVRTSWMVSSVVAQVEGADVAYTSISAGPPPPRGLFSPVLVQGRRAVAGDEVVAAEETADTFGLRVGSTLKLRLLTADQVAQFDTGFGEPAGAAIRVRVTGIVRLPTGGQGLGGLIAPEAFDALYHSYSIGPTVLLRLQRGARSAPELVAAVDRLSQTIELPAGAEEFGPLQPVFPQRSEDPKVRTAQRVLVAGLGVFVVVALLAGLLAVGQGLSRHAAASAAEQRIEAALGLTSVERVLARTVPAATGAALAAVVTAAGALAAAGLEPMGGLHRFEPHPGWVPNVAVIAVGAVLTALVFLLLSAGTTWRAMAADQLRAPAATTLPGAIAARLRRPELLAGVTFAINRGRGRSAVPVRATAAGAVLGIAGVVAAATFSAGLHRLAVSPERYGWNADFLVSDAKPIDLPNVAGDPRVKDLDWVSSSTVRIGTDFVPAYTRTSMKGELPWTVLSGRLPSADDEVALGPVTADGLKARAGDTIDVPDAKGAKHHLHVVGTLLVPVDTTQRLGDCMLLTVSGLLGVQQSTPITSLLVHTYPGQSSSLRNVLARRFEIIQAGQPSEVRNVTDLGRLPDTLALFLGLVAAAALGHGLVLTSRRRQHDIAVLRSLGFTPRQVAGAVLTTAGVTSALGLVLGLPLGLAAGRVVWHEVALATPVATDVALPSALLAVIVPLVLLAAACLAALPARQSAAVLAGGVLRGE